MGVNTQLIEQQGFVLIDRLTEGDQSVTWKAVQISLNRTVSLSVLKPESAADPSAVQRFLSMARLFAKIKNAAIPSIFDIVSERNLHYIVAEYVDGPSLSDSVTQRGPFPLKDALRIALSLSEALSQLWETARIVQRNLKAENIRLNPNGRAMLSDFSLAVQALPGVAAPALDSLTSTESVWWCSPEQVRGESALTTQSDMYALGSLLYFLTTGAIPSDEGHVPVEALLAPTNGHVPPPHILNPALPVSFSRLIYRLLMKNPVDRYVSWQDIIADIRAILAGKEPSCARLDETAPSLIDLSRMNEKLGQRKCFKTKARNTALASYQTRTIWQAQQRQIRRESLLLKTSLWIELAIWFGVWFWFCSLPPGNASKTKLDRFLKPLKATVDAFSEKFGFRKATGEGNGTDLESEDDKVLNADGAPIAYAEQSPRIGPAPSAASIPAPVGASLPADTLKALAKAFAAQRLDMAKTVLAGMPQTVTDKTAMIALLERLPSPEALAAEELKKDVGNPIRISWKGEEHTVMLQAIKNGTLYVEFKGRQAKIAIDKLAVDDLLKWSDPPKTPEASLAYCLLLLRSESRRDEVSKYAKGCPLFADSLEAAKEVLEITSGKSSPTP